TRVSGVRASEPTTGLPDGRTKRPQEVSVRAIDAWVNPNLPYDVGGDRDVGYLVKGGAERRRRGTTLDELVGGMDEAGIERAVLCAGCGEVDDRGWCIDALERYPGRFQGSIVIDPRKAMEAV